MQKNLQSLLTNYKQIAYPIIREDFAPDCCVAATKITIEVFTRLGFKAKPLPCRLDILNRQFAELEGKLGRPPTIEEQKLAFERGDKLAALSIREVPAEKDKFTGHMVAIVEQYMIDATILQAERPNKGIVFPEPVLVINAPRAFRRGREAYSFRTKEGILLVYIASNNDKYMNSPDWTLEERTLPAITRILFQLQHS